MESGKFLIVVDMQTDFVDGALGTKEAEAILPAVARRIEKRKAEGWTVLATLDTHQENYLQTQEGAFLPVRHCVKGTPGWQLHPAVQKALEGARLVEKPTFGSVRLPELIREITNGNAPEEIEVLGLCTDICVVSNALILKANFPETPLSVPADCCAGVTPQKHEAALETMRSCQIRVL